MLFLLPHPTPVVSRSLSYHSTGTTPQGHYWPPLLLNPRDAHESLSDLTQQWWTLAQRYFPIWNIFGPLFSEHFSLGLIYYPQVATTWPNFSSVAHCLTMVVLRPCSMSWGSCLFPVLLMPTFVRDLLLSQRRPLSPAQDLSPGPLFLDVPLHNPDMPHICPSHVPQLGCSSITWTGNLGLVLDSSLSLIFIVKPLQNLSSPGCLKCSCFFSISPLLIPEDYTKIIGEKFKIEMNTSQGFSFF